MPELTLRTPAELLEVREIQEAVFRGGGDCGFSERESICALKQEIAGVRLASEAMDCGAGRTNWATLMAVSSVVLQQENLQSPALPVLWPQCMGMADSEEADFS